MTWVGFAGIFALFFLTHSVPLRPFVKSRIVNHIGTKGFRISYSVLSLGVLILLIRAAGQAPYVQLWPYVGWQRHIVQSGMLVVCLILAFSIARPNPFSFGGWHDDAFDPNSPGLVRITRHPILLALALWAVLHLLPNGDLAHVVLFGVLGSFAIGGRGLINRRKRREMGKEQWEMLNAKVAHAPLLKMNLSSRQITLRLMLGVVLYLGLQYIHLFMIGVSAY